MGMRRFPDLQSRVILKMDYSPTFRAISGGKPNNEFKYATERREEKKGSIRAGDEQ